MIRLATKLSGGLCGFLTSVFLVFLSAKYLEVIWTDAEIIIFMAVIVVIGIQLFDNRE